MFYGAGTLFLSGQIVIQEIGITQHLTEGILSVFNRDVSNNVDWFNARDYKLFWILPSLRTASFRTLFGRYVC